MDQLVAIVNKWTVSVAAGVLYFWLNVGGWLGDSSDLNLEPAQVLVVVALVLIGCFGVEWAYRRRGFLPTLTVVPDHNYSTSNVIMHPTTWNE